MARPAKSVTTRTGHMSKNEIDARIEYEAKKWRLWSVIKEKLY